MSRIFQKLIAFDQNALAVILLVIFYTLEQLLNTAFVYKRRGGHLLNSILLQVGYVVVNYFYAFVVVTSFQWIGEHQVGLLNQVTIPYFLKVIIGLICFDFVFYWSHRLYHNASIFWRLHRVHHSDTVMDSSTAFRFHPFDALLDSSMSIVAAAIFGLDVNTILFYFVLFLPLIFAQHSNFVFPAWTDNVLGKIFVAPNFHKVHHHQNQEYTDSNYGFLFIFWDKLFGTFKYLPVKEIKYGLKEFDEPKKQNAWYLFKSAFLNIKRTAKHQDIEMPVD